MSATSSTFEIIDGVRRAKAVHLAAQRGVGDGRVRVLVLDAGRTVCALEVAASELLSPYATIELSGAGLLRWVHTLHETLGGQRPPPLVVRRGPRGTPIRDVTLG